MKNKIIILILMISFFHFFLYAKLKWSIVKKEEVNYSQRYPKEMLKFILWELKNDSGEFYKGISVRKNKYTKFSEGDEVYIEWDQFPTKPRDLLHTVYTFYPKYFDKKFKQALIIIGDVNYVEKEK